MKCFMCKGLLANKLTTFMVDIDGSIIIIKNTPSQVCNQCEETSYTDDVSRQLIKIVNSLRSSSTEITVADYQVKAA